MTRAEAQPQAAPAGQEAAAPQQEPQTEQAAQDKALMAGNQAAPLPGRARRQRRPRTPRRAVSYP